MPQYPWRCMQSACVVQSMTFWEGRAPTSIYSSCGKFLCSGHSTWYSIHLCYRGLQHVRLKQIRQHLGIIVSESIDIHWLLGSIDIHLWILYRHKRAIYIWIISPSIILSLNPFATCGSIQSVMNIFSLLSISIPPPKSSGLVLHPSFHALHSFVFLCHSYQYDQHVARVSCENGGSTLPAQLLLPSWFTCRTCRKRKLTFSTS